MDMATDPKNPSAGISTTVEAPESWKRVVKVEIDRTRFDKEYDSRLKKAAKSHQKPGFRKGKTPRAVVERELGDYIRSETVEDLVPKAWMTAVLEHKLAPVNDPALENLDFADDGPLRFDLVVEVRPEITLGDLDAMPVRKRAVEVGIRQFIVQTHVESPMELTPESRGAFQRLRSAGWLVTNQLVFTASASRRGHTAKLRQVLSEVGVLPYYTFAVKGFAENHHNYTPIARLVQEQVEEKVCGVVPAEH